MKTPKAILEKFENASEGLHFGDVTLRLSLKQGKSRYVINREESFIPTDESFPSDSHFKKSGSRGQQYE